MDDLTKEKMDELIKIIANTVNNIEKNS